MRKPKVVVSRCLGFSACRYNGQVIEDDFVEKLKDHVDYLPVCAEVEIGLGVPRDPIRLVRRGKNVRLMQPATGKDFSSEMDAFAERFLSSLEDVDGFILKNKSPSCGVKDVKVYAGLEKGAAVGRDLGCFAKKAWEFFPCLAVEDEGRLRNHRIREHFLTRLYATARFRGVKNKKDLLSFHAENKLLFMAYNQKESRMMGRAAAEGDIDEYGKHLCAALEKPPRCSSVANVLMHAYGYFKGRLASKERKFFFEGLKKYREKRVPLGSLLTLLQSWIIRFDEPYLQKQTFFAPYPEELVEAVEECLCGED